MNNKSKVSLSTIAKELGVSTSTVSRALNGHPSISKEVSTAVRELASELHYVPNRMAVGLKKGRQKIIGVIVPMISRNFFASVIEGIEDYAYANGFDVIICQSKNLAQQERRVVDAMSGKVDGVIASIASHNESHSYFNNLTIPLVQFDRVDNSIKSSCVTIDDYAGACMAVEHLVDQGFRKIFHFSGPTHINIWSERKRGYTETLTKHNINIEDHWIYEAPTTELEGRNFAEKIIKTEKYIPDAIFSSGDYAALGIMQVFRENGIDIPIVGFANEPFCEFISPSLSSVDQYSNKIGSTACKMVIDLLNGHPSTNTIITPELIIRESSIKKIKQ